MRGMVVTEYGAPLEERDLDPPQPAPGHAVIQVLTCGVCFSDVKIARGRMPFSAGLALPHVPGHEICARVLETDPAFHAQQVYAAASRTLATFESALGRRLSWGFNGHHLHLVPHAFAEANAYYSFEDRALLFGYVPSDDGEATYTCLSYDVAVHETAHGLAMASFGRKIHKAGLKLVMIFPYAFVDTSEAWFEPRKRRIAISAAGRIEPAKSAPVEIVAVAANRTAGILGGITVLMSEPDAVRPRAWRPRTWR